MASGGSVHVSVLLSEVLEALRPQAGGSFVDGTFGGGGHARAIAEQVGSAGRVLGVDRDPLAAGRLESRGEGLPIDVVCSNYTEIPEILSERGLGPVDGILLDLGLSSDQLADSTRGFSFQVEGPLDLRFDPTQGEPAWRLINRLRENELADVIFQYGEERHSRRISRRIVAEREKGREWTASELAQLVRSCVPRSRVHGIDPATRTFQALRIAVNGELENLKRALAELPDCLAPGGRLAIISFHSLEDRLVKHAFREDERMNVVTRRPINSSEEEAARNPRARSAKLRVAERVSNDESK